MRTGRQNEAVLLLCTILTRSGNAGTNNNGFSSYMRDAESSTSQRFVGTKCVRRWDRALGVDELRFN